MSNTIAIVLIVALFSDTLANIARMIGVIIAIRQQERLSGNDKGVAEAIVAALENVKDKE